MADKDFGVKKINLISTSGTAKVTSPTTLNLNAPNVAISTDMSVGGQVSLGAGTSISSPGSNILTLGVNNTEKLRVNSSGVNITGTASATSFSGSGASLTDLPGMSTSSKTAAHTLVAGDNNSLIRTNSNITVPASVFSIADAITIYNNSSSSISIVQGGSVTLRLSGSNITGTRTLAQRGICNVLCVASNEFIITGSGLA